MHVAFLLCDAAQTTSDGKVYILGAGWRWCGPVLSPHAVVAIVSANASTPNGIELHPVLSITEG